VPTGKPGKPGLGRCAGDVADEVEADLLLLSSEAVHSKARRAPAGAWRGTSRWQAAGRRLSKRVARVRRRWMPTCSPSLSAAQVRLQAARCQPAAPRVVLVRCRTDSDWCGRSAPPALRSTTWCTHGAASLNAAAVGPCAARPSRQKVCWQFAQAHSYCASSKPALGTPNKREGRKGSDFSDHHQSYTDSQVPPKRTSRRA